MKAAVWHSKRDLRVEDFTAPSGAGPGEALVEVALCGICGTDLHEYIDGPQYIPLEAHRLGMQPGRSQGEVSSCSARPNARRGSVWRSPI
jgi:threonine dehydrogenase-like Zn-dependent dehydrogenase